MNRKLLIGVVSGALALPLAASVQADATVYGNLRYGVSVADDGKAGSNSMWTLGANRGSRFGIKGSMEAGEGGDGRIPDREKSRWRLDGKTPQRLPVGRLWNVEVRPPRCAVLQCDNLGRLPDPRWSHRLWRN